MSGPLLGGVEAGGTKIVCLIGTGPDDIRAETRFPTGTPETAAARIVDFFRSAEHAVSALGIASFGPVAVDRRSPDWGHILKTPKPGWSGADLAGPLHDALGVPIALDTDVNGAALAEGRWGAARGLSDYAYITVGTGIGGGAVAGGALVHGALHPEMGHMPVPRDPDRDPYEGRCPFHGDCLEGLACGPAMAERWDMGVPDIPDGHRAWALEAEYLAVLAANLAYVLSPRRLIFGGGVMARRSLFAPLREATAARLGGYLVVPPYDGDLSDYIVPPGLADRAGPLGALALALTAPPELPARFGG